MQTASTDVTATSLQTDADRTLHYFFLHIPTVGPN
jgi:hypothetical protein